MSSENPTPVTDLKIGYAHVSTREQNFDLQVEIFRGALLRRKRARSKVV